MNRGMQKMSIRWRWSVTHSHAIFSAVPLKPAIAEAA